MRPLSIFTYYSRNKRKALPVLLILALAVFGISLSLVLTGAIYDSVRTMVQPYYKFVVIEPNYAKKVNQVDPGLRAELHHSPHLAALLPVTTRWTYQVSIGPTTQAPLFAVSDTYMEPMLAATGTHLVAGRLPSMRADEVALFESVALSRRIWVGSQIGREVDRDDRIGGKWTVVGIIGGSTPLSLLALERITKGQPAEGVLLIPRPAEMNALISDIQALATDKVIVETPTYWNKFLDSLINQFDLLLNAINGVIIVVLSLGVGLLNVIYFRQRLSEFGLLAGIGYSRFYIIRRVTLEALLLTVVAWLAGIAFSILVYQSLNLLVFQPRGTTLNFLNERALGGTLPVPIFVWVFSTVTVVTQLRRLDPVAVIERRD